MHWVEKKNQNKWGPDIDIKLPAHQTEQQPQMRRSHSQSKKSQEEAETKQSSKENIHQVRWSGQNRYKATTAMSREPMQWWIMWRGDMVRVAKTPSARQQC